MSHVQQIEEQAAAESRMDTAAWYREAGYGDTKSIEALDAEMADREADREAEAEAACDTEITCAVCGETFTGFGFERECYGCWVPF